MSAEAISESKGGSLSQLPYMPMTELLIYPNLEILFY